MQIDFDSERPIFQQIADGLEDAILSGVFPEGRRFRPLQSFPSPTRSTRPPR